jgi:hypothetical protein
MRFSAKNKHRRMFKLVENCMCSVKMVTGIDRRTTTFCCSWETGDLWLKIQSHYTLGGCICEHLHSQGLSLLRKLSIFLYLFLGMLCFTCPFCKSILRYYQRNHWILSFCTRIYFLVKTSRNHE